MSFSLENWILNVKKFCDFYNIPLEYLSDTLFEPKVVPMIRGKAFEFTVMMALKETLPEDEFSVEKEPMNAQIGFHDIDVSVTHKPSGIQFSLECKLASKGGYRFDKDSKRSRIRVKCMRSRTLGASKVEELAPKLGIPKNMLAIHNDQYLPTDFDFVVTSIGNAFYVTDDNGIFTWRPKKQEIKFLDKLDSKGVNNLKDVAFHKLYIASSYDLSIASDNQIKCTRRKCPTPDSCGFIPNYPEIHFPKDAIIPEPPWHELEKVADLFRLATKHI